jgi:hypothetical protein
MKTQSESSFGSVKVHSFTLSYTPGNMKCDSWASFLACTLASPCLGREPKVRAATKRAKGFEFMKIIFITNLNTVGSKVLN